MKFVCLMYFKMGYRGRGCYHGVSELATHLIHRTREKVAAQTLRSSEMSAMSLESPDLKEMSRTPAPAARSAPPCSADFSSAMYPSLAAINTGWAGFINRRLKENLALPEQLGECKSLWSVLRLHGAYCRTAVAQYQTTFAQFQQIGLNLASEFSAASLVPVRIPAPQRDHTARSPDRAARDCFP